MYEYYIGIYTKDKPFDKDVVWKSLEVVLERYPGFFPAKFEKARKIYHDIVTPADFSYDLIPKGYWIEEGVSVRIPIVGNNGAELVILDDRDSTIIPSSVVLGWKKKELLPDTAIVEAVFAGLIEVLHPVSARVTHNELLIRDDVYERSFLLDDSVLPEALTWMTLLGPKHIATIGEAQIEKIKDFVSLTPCADGYILTLMQEPYYDDNPAHVAFRKEIEDKLGLTALYKKLEG